jgi:hypothetical protein
MHLHVENLVFLRLVKIEHQECNKLVARTTSVPGPMNILIIKTIFRGRREPNKARNQNSSHFPTARRFAALSCMMTAMPKNLAVGSWPATTFMLTQDNSGLI